MKRKLPVCIKGLAVLLLTCIFSSMASAQKLLDNLASQPAAAYSVRLLKTSYTGAAMQVRRSNDSQLVDVYFDASGNVSLNSAVSAAGGGAATATLLGAWIGSNSAFVGIWYDQSGNMNNAIQATAAYQPRIINAGAMEVLPNGMPTLKMLNAATGGTGFDLFTLAGLTNLNVFMAVRQDDKVAGSNGGHLFGTSGPTGATPGKMQMHYNNTSTSNTFGMQSSTAYTNRLNLTNGNFYSVRFKVSPENSGTGQIFIATNANTLQSNALTTVLDNTIATLFRSTTPNTVRNLDGVSSEVICYTTAITNADAFTIMDNENYTYISVPPISSTATDVVSDGFTANWAAPVGGTLAGSKYIVQYSTTADFSSGNVTTSAITGLSRTITGLVPAKQYWYRVLVNTGGTDGGYGAWSAVQTVATTLPIKLQSFTAKKVSLGAELNWSTASENNNDHFDIERSVDGQSFAFIGRIQGAINSSSVLNYSFIDKNPVAGTNYYRLKQVDANGDFEYVKPVFLDYSLAAKLVIYPNPVADVLHLDLHHNTGQQLTVNIIDLSGKVVKSARLQNSLPEINIASLTSGIYFIEVLTASGDVYLVRTKFIKQ